MAETLMRLRLSAITWRAEGVHEFELRHPQGEALPAFTAGAHIDLHLPGGLVRSYSLCNGPDETHRYVVAVGLDANSRGGSRHLHEAIRVGALLTVSAPSNTFALDEDAPHTLLVAGGIGITPLWCMAQRLASIGRKWTLFYAARSRRSAAFVREIEQLARESRNSVRLHFDDEAGGPANMALAFDDVSRETHAYCCGPAPMIDAFRRTAEARLPEESIHVEFFKAPEVAHEPGGAFTVELKRSAQRLEVPADKTLLDTLLDAGIDLPYSCMEGICGSCQLHVLDGVPDHRDSVLSKRQRESNEVMIACCSRAKTAQLVLDV